jgi:lipopolysaccharide export system protein LptA
MAVTSYYFGNAILEKLNLLYSICIILIPFTLPANTGLELIHADKNVSREQNGRIIHEFEGNVHFRQDTLEMFCENALLYENKNMLQFTKNVLITNGHSRLRALKINYFTETKKAFCYDSVRIKTPKDSLYAEFLEYNFKTDEAEAEKNIYLYDAENTVFIRGEKGIYDPNKNHNLVRENAWFTKIDTASGDTLDITAVQLEYFGGEDKRAVATDSVVILQGALKAVCDSAVYHTDTELVSLFGSPFAWYEDNKLSGVSMQAQFDSLKLKEIIVFENARAVSLADSVSGKENVLTGNKIQFEIEKNKPKLVTSTDNATSTYYLRNENEDQGSNYATSDTIQVYFVKGKLDSIAIIGGSEGTFYPSDYKGKKVYENDQQ